MQGVMTDGCGGEYCKCCMKKAGACGDGGNRGGSCKKGNCNASTKKTARKGSGRMVEDAIVTVVDATRPSRLCLCGYNLR